MSQDQPHMRASVEEAIREMVGDLCPNLEISMEDAVDAVLRHVRVAIYQVKAHSAQMSYDAFLATVHDSDDFPHLLDHEVFMGIVHTPETIEKMHRAYLSHREAEWASGYEAACQLFQLQPRIKASLSAFSGNSNSVQWGTMRDWTPETMAIAVWAVEQRQLTQNDKLDAEKSAKIMALFTPDLQPAEPLSSPAEKLPDFRPRWGLGPRKKIS
jgi:hypothetical protein